MNLNHDFRLRVVQHAADAVWTPSPLPGVTRCMLDRVGDEVARATSLVSDAAGSRFDAHGHPGGEEILVLDGVFSDEYGDYPAAGPICAIRRVAATRRTPAPRAR